MCYRVVVVHNGQKSVVDVCNTEIEANKKRDEYQKEKSDGLVKYLKNISYATITEFKVEPTPKIDISEHES